VSKPTAPTAVTSDGAATDSKRASAELVPPSWPAIEYWELADFYRTLRAALLDLEQAHGRNELEERVACSGLEAKIGSRLLKVYEHLARQPNQRLAELRMDAVHALLEQVREDVFNTVTVALVRAVISAQAAGPDAQVPATAARAPIQRVVATIGEGQPCDLRFDQLLAVRFWGIGFEFPELDMTCYFARHVARASTNRLAKDLRDLHRILKRFHPSDPCPELHIAASPNERRFEQLMLDVLNESSHRARPAGLHEDFLEKTDLRVKYSDAGGDRGVRVQVTQISDPHRHREKLARIHGVEEYVILSPRTLAEFVARTPDKDEANQGMSPAAREELLRCFNEKPGDIDELAWAIKRTLLNCYKRATSHPAGPVHAVPGPLRDLICAFTRADAKRAWAAHKQRRAQFPLSGDRRSSARMRRASAHGSGRYRRSSRQILTRSQREAIEALRVGTTIKGRVRAIKPYGAFIDLGGVSGLLHTSQIPGPRGEHPDWLQVDAEFPVVVLDKDASEGKVTLGLATKS